jgi:hypothetical protein
LEEKKMDYTIKHVTTERELDNALGFSRKVFGEQHTGLGSRQKAKSEWLGHIGVPPVK